MLTYATRYCCPAKVATYPPDEPRNVLPHRSHHCDRLTSRMTKVKFDWRSTEHKVHDERPSARKPISMPIPMHALANMPLHQKLQPTRLDAGSLGWL